MKVLEIVLPVLVMIILGILCRKCKILNQNGIDNMKTLVTNIMLPVAIFHALATAQYSGKIGMLVAIMLVMLVVSFGIGFLLRSFMEEPYKKYLPFLVCIYEGGMMAYPLYTSLCGSENLSQIAVLDIAGLLFGFSIYMGMLGQIENGEKINAGNLFFSAIKTPAFIGTVLGILAGLTGVIDRLVASPFGDCYLGVENILTTSITPIILIVVGYSMELVPELIRPCIKTILMRIILQALMIAGVLVAVKYLVGSSRLLNLAIITYMSSPATFSMQTFLKKRKAAPTPQRPIRCIVWFLLWFMWCWRSQDEMHHGKIFYKRQKLLQNIFQPDDRGCPAESRGIQCKYAGQYDAWELQPECTFRSCNCQSDIFCGQSAGYYHWKRTDRHVLPVLGKRRYRYNKKTDRYCAKLQFFCNYTYIRDMRCISGTGVVSFYDFTGYYCGRTGLSWNTEMDIRAVSDQQSFDLHAEKCGDSTDLFYHFCGISDRKRRN